MLQAFRKGEPEAVAEVEGRVRRIIGHRGYGIPEAERDELRQEVLVQVWQSVNRDGFDAERGFWGFVQVVTARRCIDWRRKRREERATNLSLVPDSGRGPLKRILASERRHVVRAAVEQLGRRCRELIEYRVSEGRSYAEIADLTGRSEQALRAQMYRCIKSARSFVEAPGRLSHETR